MAAAKDKKKSGKAGKLTEKQEAFARVYFESANAAHAYRTAYDVSENARDEWIYVEACQLLDNPKVALRVQQLRDKAEAQSLFTRHKAMEEYEEARVLAHSEGQASAAVSATSAKIKLLGLDKPIKIEHTGKDGEALEATPRELAKAVAAMLKRGLDGGS